MGLPTFTTTALGAHSNAAFEADNSLGALFTLADVGLHFDGGMGINSIEVQLTSSVSSAYYADNVAAATVVC